MSYASNLPCSAAALHEHLDAQFGPEPACAFCGGPSAAICSGCRKELCRSHIAAKAIDQVTRDRYHLCSGCAVERKAQ